MNFFERSLELHKELKGKIGIQNKMDLQTSDDLSLAYSPGVAQPCLAIADNPEDVYTYTLKGNTVAVVSDGSAVLGLGNIGPNAAIPVMEGKALLFKKFAGIDAFPICLDTQDTEEIIKTIKNIAPVFGGINLEDIAAPRCFEIEQRLQDLGIPVFHDDQHGTAIVVLAGLINAAKLKGKSISELKVVINGAGAAGIAIARLLKGIGAEEGDYYTAVKDVIVCDSKEIIHSERQHLNGEKIELLQYTNKDDLKGSLKDALVGADVFIGVSKANLLTATDISTMAGEPIIFALANPVPEIMPEEAYKGGAAVVGTGRSDLPNQINNVLCFPGIFRGALDAGAPRITMAMKLAAAYAIADSVAHPTPEAVIPSVLDLSVSKKVAQAVKNAAVKKVLNEV
ncbi:NADP-dependent malic enzyme [Chitinophagaceae bacterium LB-8]|uniref:NADP-dependent malic enzyme n=1 Tax=Paraflavisolibacter caeni TaxID=2982496 RepID=A0A9X3B7V0_9BACT|nr:NADP-dependent malic enzyme [Paraflavisolibacter caeni]MCU7549740.1 NADP-dependent malic enzyme [Paraflavisolibacter caeni]